MKRSLFTLLFAIVVVFSFAQVNENDVTMVSYEQSWLDSRGTLALKNNTDKDIHNVTFRITYLDMSGNPLDYEEFVKEIDIAPGMTRKLDIPSYEHSRNYHYYKTKDEYGHPAFKINFELKDYNSTIEHNSDDELSDVLGSYSYDREDRGLSDLTASLVGLLIILFIVGAWIGMYIIVAVMAQRRNRSVVIWVLLSMIASPLLMIIILLVVGNDNRNNRHYDS
jgi:hypothetical protein